MSKKLYVFMITKWKTNQPELQLAKVQKLISIVLLKSFSVQMPPTHKSSLFFVYVQKPTVHKYLHIQPFYSILFLHFKIIQCITLKDK